MASNRETLARREAWAKEHPGAELALLTVGIPMSIVHLAIEAKLAVFLAASFLSGVLPVTFAQVVGILLLGSLAKIALAAPEREREFRYTAAELWEVAGGHLAVCGMIWISAEIMLWLAP